MDTRVRFQCPTAGSSGVPGPCLSRRTHAGRIGRILTLLLAECGRPRPQQARDFLSAQENHRHAVFATLLRPRTGALL
jgi:hypothetical protein